MTAQQLEVDTVVTGSIDAQVLTPPELRVADALLRCVARWGLSKTTIEDIAREAGVSRATVYRLFPGGKSAIMYAAVRAEVQRMLTEVTDEARTAENLEECLVQGMHQATVFFDGHPALAFMRDHERAVLEQMLSFDRMDVLFLAAGTVMAPVLSRFLDDEDAFIAGTWAARLVVSYLSEPAEGVDLCDRDHVRTLVRTFMVPGLPPTRCRSMPASAAPATT